MKTVFMLLTWVWVPIARSQDPNKDAYVNPATLVPPNPWTTPKDDLDRKIEQSYGERPPDWSWVTEELRPVVLERLLADKAKGFNEQFIGQSDARLISFGHAETIQEVLAKEIANPHLQSLQLYYASDEALPFVMPLVMTGSVVDPDGPGHKIAERDHFARLALQFIRNGHFPPETLKWAERMGVHPGGKGTEERIELLKEWWRHNEAAITANRPMEATWLPALFRGEPSYASDEELAERRAEIERRREGMKSGQAGSGVNAGLGPSEEKDPRSSNAGNRGFLLMGGIVATLLIVAGCFLKRQKV